MRIQHSSIKTVTKKKILKGLIEITVILRKLPPLNILFKRLRLLKEHI